MSEARRVALVTGSSRGIGKATAIGLAKSGVNIAVNYLSDQAAANSVVAEIESCGGRALAIKADISSKAEVESLVEAVIQHFGRFDILVNNAGAIIKPNSWQEITEESWNRTIDVNLKGVFNCTRAAASYLSESGTGCVVNISSTFGTVIGSEAVMAYGAAKSGIVSMTIGFAKALAPLVRVNCVSPGVIDTDMTSSSPHEFVAKQIARTPLQRIGLPIDVANTVLYLVSPWSTFVTGQVIVVDGGHSLS